MTAAYWVAIVLIALLTLVAIAKPREPENWGLGDAVVVVSINVYILWLLYVAVMAR